MPFPDRFDPIAAEELPRTITLSVPRDELEEVVTWSQRFATSPMTPTEVLCLLSHGSRRWVCTEANVEAWCDFADIDQRATAAVVLPQQVLDSALLASHRDEPVTIEADLDAARLTVRSPGFTFGCDMPALPERVPALDFPVGNSLVVPGSHMEAAAQVLRVPAGRFDGENDAPWPYVTVGAGNRTVHMVRDWSEFDGGRVVVDIETIGGAGVFEGTAAFYSDVVLRELWLLTNSGVEAVSFRVFGDCPDIMVITCENWGMRVALGSEFVLRYRRPVENALGEAGFEVEKDERRDWSPVVRAEANGRPITVELLRAERINLSHARITGLVAEGLTWSTELGGELNSWNDAWSTCKLLFRDGTLVVVRDVPVGSLDLMPAAVTDVVEKVKTVFDVVGPLM